MCVTRNNLKFKRHGKFIREIISVVLNILFCNTYYTEKKEVHQPMYVFHVHIS